VVCENETVADIRRQERIKANRMMMNSMLPKLASELTRIGSSKAVILSDHAESVKESSQG